MDAINDDQGSLCNDLILLLRNKILLLSNKINCVIHYTKYNNP